MIEKIRYLFHSKDHRKIMLAGILISAIMIYLVLALSAFYLGFDFVFWVKLSVASTIILLFGFYLKYHNTSLTAIILFIILEIDTSLGLLNKQFFDFISIYPFFVIFGFFFFFKLKTALWMTLAHFVYWIITTTIRQNYIMEHPNFQMVIVDINMFATSVVVVLLGIFYNLSTKLTYEKLKKSNEKNETLLKEIHHRIKNNLNIIASIFGLQILNIQKGVSKSAEEVLKDNKMRIEAIAMIHESLYQNYNIEEVLFDEYVENLTTLINKTYNKNILVNIDSNNINLSLEIMFHFGIILNELFTNSIKYAFKSDEKRGKVLIALSKEGEYFHFVYHESYNENIDIKKMLSSKTLGMKLIELSIKQMNGTFDITCNDGLIFTINFKS